MPDLSVLMLASENDALPGAKVGGIGDVVRDVPPALAETGALVTVVIPSYGFLKQKEQLCIGNVAVDFRGSEERVSFFQARPRRKQNNVSHIIADHPLFVKTGTNKRIYTDDPPDRPFASDADLYAFFCASVIEAQHAGLFVPADVVHLHDWHAALYLLLLNYSPSYAKLKKVRTVFTIHNLSLQGIRPFAGDTSSLAAWFPKLPLEKLISISRDPRYPDCVNPMSVGIRLADRVHTVSPTYAEEICRPSIDTETRKYKGGEGLEKDILEAKKKGRLFGILNGIHYREKSEAEKTLPLTDLIAILKEEVLEWIGSSESLSSAHYLALTRLSELEKKIPAANSLPPMIFTAVSRMVEQKMRLFSESPGSGSNGKESSPEGGLRGGGTGKDSHGRPGVGSAAVLEHMLSEAGDEAIFFILGTGDPLYEKHFREANARYSNLVFLNGFSNRAAESLYRGGDCFLMPSLFEPCGISQMLAMQEGQPCIVHRIGGLKDTVRDGIDGFSFEGPELELEEQAANFLSCFRRAFNLRKNSSDKWEQIRRAAASRRFEWKQSIKDYLKLLYT